MLPLFFDRLLSYLVGIKRRTSRCFICKRDNSYFLLLFKKPVHNAIRRFSCSLFSIKQFCQDFSAPSLLLDRKQKCWDLFLPSFFPFSISHSNALYREICIFWIYSTCTWWLWPWVCRLYSLSATLSMKSIDSGFLTFSLVWSTWHVKSNSLYQY